MSSLLMRLSHARALGPAQERVFEVPRAVERAVEPAPGRVDASMGFVRREACWFGGEGIEQVQLLAGSPTALRLPALGVLGRALIGLGAQAGARPVFIDTETTGLSHGGALPFLIGLAWHDGASLRTRQWRLTRLGAEAAMLTDLLTTLRELGPAPLVSFNGASFDLPLLRARARRYRLAAPELEGEHLDLLHGARRLWKGRLPDCRLSTLETRLLGVVRHGDIPSAEIPAVFWDALRDAPGGEAHSTARMEAVIAHNLVDLLTLPMLAQELAINLRAPADLDQALRVARHLLRLGLEEQARSLLAEWLEGPGVSDGKARSSVLVEAALELATLHRRAGERARAAELWRLAWSSDPRSPAAAEAWAKHLEHHEGDFAEALRVVQGSRLPCPRRLARLRRRASPEMEETKTTTETPERWAAEPVCLPRSPVSLASGSGGRPIERGLGRVAESRGESWGGETAVRYRLYR
ncbi:MAG: ribonuclease H-like domain-containing protein [Myxococcales bacterium]|nr:ribonuclease H-like domain-containing protein [Myxococcales bacterium]